MVIQIIIFEITEKEGHNKITKFIFKITLNMEELLSKSILYNLNILKHAVACSQQMQETLVEYFMEVWWREMEDFPPQNHERKTPFF